MSGNMIAMLEMLIPFGLFLGFLVYQLVSIKRTIREDEARARHEEAAKAAAAETPVEAASLDGPPAEAGDAAPATA
jgi:hypothetical protein